MERGTDFLKAQVANAVMQHNTFLDSLVDHEKQADDQRFRDLCSKYIPMMRQHQRSLEQYAEELRAESSTAKKAFGKMAEVAKGLADSARETDFLRLVQDIVMARQSEDTFKTFRDAGRTLGNTRLAEIGDHGEKGHDEYVKEANRLVQQMFVEHVKGTTASDVRTATGARPTESRPGL